MRQFILAKSVAESSVEDLSLLANGAVGIFYDNNGVLTLASTGAEVTKEASLVLGRSAELGGPVVLPLYKNAFSFVKGDYAGSAQFEASYTVPAPTYIGDYSIIVVLKGVDFNVRNKWTASVHVTDTSMTAADLASKLATAINNNSVSSGVEATVAEGVITITALKAGVDYEIKGADALFGVDGEVTTPGHLAYGDAAYVKDLADKAAADAGFAYTYRDANVDMYPNYPLNPLAQPDAEDTGFDIFTLRFAEPRKVKTTDELVYQIVQVAFPHGAAGVASFETICKDLAGIVEDTDSDE